MTSLKLLKSALVTALLATTALPSAATQTDNKGIHAVPSPKGAAGVAIDGKLDDWDLSGQVQVSYDIEALRDVYSAQVAMMYDAENFYVALHWKDPIPMGNTHHPRYQANKGWAGDSVQLRIKTDRISHVTAWYYAPGKEPALQISYGKNLTEPFGGGDIQLFRTQGWKMDQRAEMAFQKDADGRGYVQEIKLPWKLITAEKTPQAGEKIACGVELLWGEADWPVHRYADNLQPGATSREFFWTARDAWGPVWLEAKGGLNLPEADYMKAARAGEEPLQGPVEIRYDLPKNARVTVAIDTVEPSGKLSRIRNLVPALPRQKGTNVEKWDGLDDNGKLMAPGNYKFTALYHDGIHVNYVMTFASPGNPGWDTASGRGAFYGDHTAPRAVAAAGDYVALASPMGEGGKHLIGCDLNGQRLWGLANLAAFDGGHISLATDGKTLWVATEGKKSIIYRVNIASGQYVPWQAKGKDAQGNEFDLLELQVSEAPGVGADAKAGTNMSAIALQGNTLAVCLMRENKVKLLDAQTGKTLEELDILAPRSVAFDPRWKMDRSLLVLSGDKLINVWRRDSYPVFFAPISLPPGAHSVASDSLGHIFISVRGAEQNVKVFSAQGKKLGEIGKRGGRAANGAFDANAMRNPAQIAVDSKGRLWVAEETNNPKRTSIWNVSGSSMGKLVRDLNGTGSYSGAGAINPFDPTMAFAENTIWKIDLKSGAWRPVYSLGKRDLENELFPPVAESRSRVIVNRGRTYLFTTDTARGAGEAHVTVFDGKNWRSAAHLGTVMQREKVDQWVKYGHPFFEGHDGDFYAWADRNGDGLVQPVELQFSKPQIDGKAVRVRSFYWGQLPDTEGTLSYMAENSNALLKFPISSYTASGAPIYDVARPVVLKTDKPIGSGNGEGMIVGGVEGRVYINQDPLICVDKNGHVMGGYPNRHTSVHGSHNATSARPGYVIGPSSILGTANFGDYEVWDLNGNLGENYLFTHDGLFIQSLFKDVRGGFETPEQAVRGMSMDATTAGGESFGGHFTRTTNGKVYLTIGGTDARVLEVTGLDTLKRLGGTVQFTPARWDDAQKLAQEKAVKSNEARTYTIAKNTAPVVIDGKPGEWPELLDDKANLIEIRESPQMRFARAQVRYDDNSLYLAWRVFGPGKLRNAGQNPQLLFKSGDAVDLMLGPLPAKPDGEGDLRLLLTQKDGKPIAMLNQKVVPGAAKNAAERYEFASPWRSIAFDRVVQIPEVQLSTNSINGGYFVEAAIPWKALGVTPQSGLKLKGDIGVLFADAGGTQTTSRRYWSNKATGLVNDVPGEADLTPKLWGEFVLE